MFGNSVQVIKSNWAEIFEPRPISKFCLVQMRKQLSYRRVRRSCHLCNAINIRYCNAARICMDSQQFRMWTHNNYREFSKSNCNRTHGRLLHECGKWAHSLNFNGWNFQFSICTVAAQCQIAIAMAISLPWTHPSAVHIIIYGIIFNMCWSIVSVR